MKHIIYRITSAIIIAFPITIFSFLISCQSKKTEQNKPAEEVEVNTVKNIEEVLEMDEVGEIEEDKLNPVEKTNNSLPVVSGTYNNGLLFLACDGENVSGFYSNGKYKGNPNFGCSFYFYGNNSEQIDNRKINITTLNPFNLSEKPKEGTFKLHDEENSLFSLVANLNGDYCWDKELGFSKIETSPGVGFELTEEKLWLEIRIASSEKVYFYDSSDESTKEKAYVIAGDPLFVSKRDGEWLKVAFVGATSETIGWVKKENTKSLGEISELNNQ